MPRFVQVTSRFAFAHGEQDRFLLVLGTGEKPETCLWRVPDGAAVTPPV